MSPRPDAERPGAHVTVRDAVAADLPHVVELMALGGTRAGKEDVAELAAYEAALAEIDAAPRSRLLVAQVDGRTGPVVVGTLQVWAVRHVQERGGLCAEVESVHVRPDRRGSGIGSVLLAAAVDAARGWGCYRVQLTSNEVRADAHRFYVREGFTASHTGFKLALR